MKKHLLCILASAFIISAHSQSLSPTVIASAGGYSSVSGTSLSYTVGELAAVQTFKDSSGRYILTQGFQQPNDIINGLLDIDKGADGSFCVYPIPAQTIEYYGYEFAEPGKVEVSMYNIAGQRMDYTLSETYDSGKLVHSFDCSSYASGNYILTVKFTASSGQDKVMSKKITLITK
jgi:hypothetical protein